jgi:hypothetical protein
MVAILDDLEVGYNTNKIVSEASHDLIARLIERDHLLAVQRGGRAVRARSGPIVPQPSLPYEPLEPFSPL